MNRLLVGAKVRMTSGEHYGAKGIMTGVATSGTGGALRVLAVVTLEDGTVIETGGRSFTVLG